MESALNRIRKNEHFLSVYLDSMSVLHSTGIFEVLRERGRTVVTPDTIGNTQALATTAAISTGYNQCIEDLLNFSENFLGDKSIKSVKPDYGAINKLQESGEISEEEAQILKYGRED